MIIEKQKIDENEQRVRAPLESCSLIVTCSISSYRLNSRKYLLLRQHTSLEIQETSHSLVFLLPSLLPEQVLRNHPSLSIRLCLQIHLFLQIHHLPTLTAAQMRMLMLE